MTTEDTTGCTYEVSFVDSVLGETQKIFEDVIVQGNPQMIDLQIGTLGTNADIWGVTAKHTYCGDKCRRQVCYERNLIQ